MTREEILALEGLELRKAVAGANGWTARAVTPEECRRITGDYLARSLWFDEEGRWHLETLPWDSDIAAAWALLEELSGMGLSWELGNLDPGYVLKFWQHGDFDVVGEEKDPAATVICRAYLLAKAVSA